MKTSIDKGFTIETQSTRPGQPRVVFTRRIEGASRRVEVRMPQPLRERLRRHAPECHTTSIMPLAQRGLVQLIKSKQRLLSQWLPSARGGRFHHQLLPQERGQTRIECGPLPSLTKVSGRAPSVQVSIPDVLHRALRTEARHVSTALAALADWQLTQLIDSREQIRVMPLRQPPKPTRE